MLRSRSNPVVGMSDYVHINLGNTGRRTCVPQASTVSLNADLYEAIALLLADGLHPQSRRICVRDNNGNGIARLMRDARLAHRK